MGTMRRDELELGVAIRFASYVELARLPIRARVVDKLTEILIVANDLLAEFQTEEANGILWLESHVQCIYDEVDALMTRFTE